MMSSDPDFALLSQAKDRAHALLDDLIRQQAELDLRPQQISVNNLAAGRTAMQNAIASVTRMLMSIESILKNS
jgi:hypothetical protein